MALQTASPPLPSNSLRILHWNARSARRKTTDLRNLLKEEDIHVALLQEAGFPPSLTVLGDYNVVKDPAQQDSDLVILVHRQVSFSVLRLGHLPPPLLAKCAGISVKFSDETINIVNSYIHPQGNFAPLRTWDSAFTAKTIIAGDLNAHHPAWDKNCPTDRRGEDISRWVEDRGAIVANSGSPTRLGNIRQRNSSPDVAIISHQLGLRFSWNTIADPMGSDHFPCLLAISIPAASTLLREMFTTRRWNLKKVDWRVFADSDHFKELPNSESTDELSTRILYSSLIYAVERALSAQKALRHPSKKSLRHRPQPWWTKSCDEAIRRRRAALRHLLHNTSPASLEAYEQSSRLASFTLAQARTNGWHEYTASLSPSSPLSGVWRMARSFANRETPIREDSSGDWVAQFHQNLTPDFDPPEEPIWNFQDPPSPLFRENLDISELNMVLSSSKDSAPGPDGIAYSILQHLPVQAKSVLITIFNRIWNGEPPPSQWNEFVLIPILKPGKDPSSAASYRPIALTSCVRKSFQKILKNR